MINSYYCKSHGGSWRSRIAYIKTRHVRKRGGCIRYKFVGLRLIRRDK